MGYKILLNGTKEYSEKNGIIQIKNITSTVILVRTGGRIILIDPGSFFYRKRLISLLKEEGVLAEDVDLIFLTHLHPDHASSIHLFENAKVIEWKSIIDQKKGTVAVYRDISKIPLPEGMELMETPGHMLPHSSVILNDGGKKIVFAGDAIRGEMASGNYFPSGQDVSEMIDSAIRICETADIIIPGHGALWERRERRRSREIY